MDITDFSVNVGYSCNNNCIHCLLGGIRDLYPDRTIEDIFFIIDKAKKSKSSNLTIIGGDPTIRNDFLQILSYAKEQGISIYLETNGRTFSIDSFARRVFKMVPELKVGMSFHSSDSKIHDTITQVKGSWKQSVIGIQNMKKYKIKHLRVNCVISKFNYKNLPELTKFLVMLGVDEISFYLMRINGNADTNFKKLFVEFKDIKPYLYNALDIGEGLGVDIKTFGFPYCKMGGYERFVEEKCSLRNYLLGKKEIFDELTGKSEWYKSRIDTLKLKHKDCINCKYFNVCEGIWNEYLSNNYETINPIIGKKIYSLKDCKYMSIRTMLL